MIPQTESQVSAVVACSTVKTAGSEQDAKDALSKLLQMGSVAEYLSEFEILINRITEISEYLLKMFYISGLKPALQLELLRAMPTTLGEVFSLARIIEARFEEERATIALAKPNELTAYKFKILSKLLKDEEMSLIKSARVQVLIQFQSCQNAIAARKLNMGLRLRLKWNCSVDRSIFASTHLRDFFVSGRELCGAIKKMGSIGLSPALPSPRTLERARKGLLLGRNIYEGCCKLDIKFSNLEELQPNQDEHICCYYWENCFSIQNAEIVAIDQKKKHYKTKRALKIDDE
nr:reverse transcriptase [Tanacetum cinerariifolium]